jgi:hypothetical protein
VDVRRRRRRRGTPTTHTTRQANRIVHL